MACSNLEETVLLYSSGELSENEKKSFEEHIGGCAECQDEYETYRKEQEKFFTVDMLGEVASGNVDKEIIRVCSDARKKYTGAGLMPVFLKKTIYSLTFFVVGFVVVGFVAMYTGQQGVGGANVALEKGIVDSTVVGEENAVAKSASDSLNDTSKYFSKNRGNLKINGVVPVDLKGE